jgi:class 3 adenylate cyclase
MDLTRRHVTIGRQADNLLALPDDLMVSRHHARLEFENGHWWIRDLDSHNGTMLDDRPVDERAPLVNGSRVKIGETELVVLDLAPDAALTITAGSGRGLRAVKPPAPALRIMLFTDLERHTEMLQKLGDTAGRAALRDHARDEREIIARHAGFKVKGTGDGVLAWFASAQHALDCAIELQRASDAHVVEGWGPLRVRIGLNAGEPIAEDGDLFGSVVNAAARITALATGGQVFVANVVKELVAGKNFDFVDRETTTLRGFDGPVHIWELVLPR